eukprot:3711071-Prymnesium_polylepis.1
MRIQPKQEVFSKDYAQRWRRYKQPTAGHAPPDSKSLKPFTRQLPHDARPPHAPPTQLSCSRPTTHCARASTDNAEPEYDLEA